MNNKNHFELRKHKLVVFLLWLSPIVILAALIYLLIFDLQSSDAGVALIILSIILLLSGYLSYGMMYKSYYKIEGKYLKTKLGFFERKILIDEIRYIKRSSQYSNAVYKPALDFNGLVIGYGAGYHIFLAPKEEERFLNLLHSMNSKIEVT